MGRPVLAGKFQWSPVPHNLGCWFSLCIVPSRPVAFRSFPLLVYQYTEPLALRAEYATTSFDCNRSLEPKRLCAVAGVAMSTGDEYAWGDGLVAEQPFDFGIFGRTLQESVVACFNKVTLQSTAVNVRSRFHSIDILRCKVVAHPQRFLWKH